LHHRNWGETFRETSEKVGLFFESFLGGIFDFLTKGHKNMVIGVKVRHHKKRRKKKTKNKIQNKTYRIKPRGFSESSKNFP